MTKHVRLCLPLLAALLWPAVVRAQQGAAAPAAFWWEKTADAPNYTKATAWEPQFSDKSLWPQLTGQEYFLKEQWPKGRLYIWANPGKAGNMHLRKSTSLDPTKPENWIDGATGKPARELILDQNTDLLFPASATKYDVGFRSTNVLDRVRHVTVEAGASYIGGGDGAGRMIWGNVWVKKGGSIYAQGSTAFVGGQHTFFRNDNWGGGSQYFRFTKPNASVELYGNVTTSDEWRLEEGLAIVGVDSQMQPGRAATPFIQKGATLVLLDGAYWGKWCNEWSGPLDLVVRGGTVQAGLPERPLARDCTLALSFRNWSGLKFADWPGKGYDARKVSAVFENGAALRVLPAPNARAALVITRYEADGPFNGGGRAYMHHLGEYRGNGSEKKKGVFADAAFVKEFDAQPHKTLVYFARGVTVEGPVRFDHFPAGGILCEDAGAWASRANVLFGPDNLAPPAQLFLTAAAPAKDGTLGSPPVASRAE